MGRITVGEYIWLCTGLAAGILVTVGHDLLQSADGLRTSAQLAVHQDLETGGMAINTAVFKFAG